MAKEIKKNHLYIDGCDTVELAKTFGTPFTCILFRRFAKNAKRFRRSF